MIRILAPMAGRGDILCQSVRKPPGCDSFYASQRFLRGYEAFCSRPAIRQFTRVKGRLQDSESIVQESNIDGACR
jgi:hypothetical protein